jgi:hypothetical protein
MEKGKQERCHITTYNNILRSINSTWKLKLHIKGESMPIFTQSKQSSLSTKNQQLKYKKYKHNTLTEVNFWNLK